MKKRGATLIELMVGVSLTALLILSALTLFTEGLSSLNRTDTRLVLTQDGALTMRRITESLREACSVEISPDGRTLYYELPLRNTVPDPLTGEYEFVTPIVSDGIERSYYVKEDTLYSQVGSSAPIPLMSGISLKDPEKGSSYSSPYPVFSFTSLGSLKGVRITLISEQKTPRRLEYSRMSSVVELRNIK
ncbi:MAG TPA: prepilin-type N-terminal cleavage/methylation domain-containing protein [Fimbriimonadales bacterium]|nr:prepilin-type N-terminal cleavage/methylation domain-containing protein [Fimbriimonadales bacterium]